MFISPSKIRKNKLLKGRTISFETVNKGYNNMVIIPTANRSAMVDTIKSTLFRPMQLFAAYSPRRITPMGRQATIVNQKDYYADLRNETNGRIRKGKTLLQSYAGQNVVYDIFNIYQANKDVISSRFQNIKAQQMIYKVLEESIYNASQDPDYKDVFLVFPMDKAYSNGQNIFVQCLDRETTDPLPLFIKAIKLGWVDWKKYEKIKLVMFYIPSSDILLAMDLHAPDFEKEFPLYQQRLKRMNMHISGSDNLDDELNDYENSSEELSYEDSIENKKEEIKNIVFSKVAKTLHANNLTDFEAASRDERDLMFAIDKKVDDYLKKPENLKKTLSDMTDEIEKDNDVKSKAVRYIETKKVSMIRSDTMSKQIEKETEIIGSLQDLDDESKSNDPDIFKIDVDGVDKRIETSHLASFDDEYNKKQAMTDISNAISSFSNNEFSPLVVDSVNYEDSDTDVDSKRTLNVRYKTEDGKPLSFQVDIPKIVDKRYLYLGGNKKVIKKQLIRLPIVKTKNDRVEITTNYQKMTIERVNGKLSRKNAYLLKVLKLSGENPGYTVEYGDNSVVNAKMGYSNDFEYEELAGTLNKITTPKYTIIFNRDSIGDEISILDIPEGFITPERTPLGFRKVANEIKSLIFIEKGKVFEYILESRKISELSPTIFEFLSNDVLKLNMTNLPSIGKSFIYTKIKFLQTTYPMLPVIASQVGLENIMQRYNIEYYIKEKQEKEKNIEYIEVKFKNCFLYYKDTIRNTLLMNSLYLMNPEEYTFNDFNIDIPYTKYFMSLLGDSVGIHTRNTLRINLSVLIDPITRDILRDMKLPTDPIDLILYANTLLVGNQYKPLNDLTNYRIRSNELVADRLYGIIADAYVRYAKHKINGRPINLQVPKGSLISALQMEPNINDKSTLNPVIEVEQIAQASAKGFTSLGYNKFL